MKTDILKKLLWAGSSIMVLTMVHHIYGAIIYDTPFRMDITWFAVPVLAVMFLSYFMYRKFGEKLSGKIAVWMFLAVTGFIAIGTFGFVEGGFNHVVKNILFFGGVEPSVLDRIYPPEYELPNDFLFEATGVLQLVPGVYGVYLLMQLWKSRSSADE